MADDLIYLNGIDADTGAYAVPPLTAEQAAGYVRGRPGETDAGRYLAGRWDRLKRGELGLPAGVPADDVTRAGWGVVFAAGEDQAVKDALAPLVEHRRRMTHAATGTDRQVKELVYDGKQDWKEWLAGYGVGVGSVKPTRVPFYLLVVGSPAAVPFNFTGLLDVEYAVGRLHFDEVDGYRHYVESLIAYENGLAPPRGREAAFFGTRHRGDRATERTSTELLSPLAKGDAPTIGDDEPPEPPVAASQGFATRLPESGSATKAALAELLAPPVGRPAPAFLFTAGHGLVVRYREGDDGQRSRQRAEQGALLCQNWVGIGRPKPEEYFAAADLSPAARVHGLVAFLFACYGAGTPAYDQYLCEPGDEPARIAAEPFVAALPKALLGHPNGGALAVIGHVDRAWTASFRSDETGSQLVPFRNAITWILQGKPVGFALQDFGARFAALSAGLSEKLQSLRLRERVDDEVLSRAWLERNDAAGYALLGDPAARLRPGGVS